MIMTSTPQRNPLAGTPLPRLHGMKGVLTTPQALWPLIAITALTVLMGVMGPMEVEEAQETMELQISWPH